MKYISVYRAFVPENPEPFHVFAHDIAEAATLLVMSSAVGIAPNVPMITLIDITSRLRQNAPPWVAQHTWAMQESGYTGLATYDRSKGWQPVVEPDQED